MKLEYTIEQLQQLEVIVFDDYEEGDPTYYKLTGAIPAYDDICNGTEGEATKPDDLDITFLYQGEEISLFSLVDNGEWLLLNEHTSIEIGGNPVSVLAFVFQGMLVGYLQNIGLVIFKDVVDYELSQMTDTVYVYAADESSETFDPITREELWLQAIADAVKGEGGSSITVEPLSVTENDVYTAPSGKAYSPVTVNVPTGGGGASVTTLNASSGSSSVAFPSGFVVPDGPTENLIVCISVTGTGDLSGDTITVLGCGPLYAWANITSVCDESNMDISISEDYISINSVVQGMDSISITDPTTTWHAVIYDTRNE